MSASSPFALTVDECIELRLHTIDDADNEWALLAKNKEFLNRWVDWATPEYCAADVRRDMADNLSKFKSGEMYAMGIYVNGNLAGNVDIRDVIDGKTAEVGYLLSEYQTGKGLVTKSLAVLMEYVQRKHSIKTFSLNTYSDNEASKNVAKRLGFEKISEHKTENGKVEYSYEKSVNKN